MQEVNARECTAGEQPKQQKNLKATWRKKNTIKNAKIKINLNKFSI